MNFNESINYRGYTITKRKSICDDVDCYYSVSYKGKHIFVYNTILIAKMNIDERIKNNAD